MEEIINISNQAGVQVVSARELYRYLDYDRSQFARWAKKTITNNQFALEGHDWTGVDVIVEGNNVMDYAITLDFAKKITMLSSSVKGNKARDYFIACEKKLRSPELSRKEILLLALEAEERAIAAEEKLLEVAPKVAFYDEVTESSDVLDFSAVAKIINRRGFGRNNLFEFLRNKKVLRQNNEPFQNFIDRAWFKVIESKWTDKNGDTRINIKTVVYQKGVDGIIKMLKEEGI